MVQLSVAEGETAIPFALTLVAQAPPHVSGFILPEVTAQLLIWSMQWWLSPTNSTQIQ